MSIAAIIQARMGSTRLPEKVLEDIGGETMLARVVRRTQKAQAVAQVVVATSLSTLDEPILSECRRLGVPVFRGEEQDVLDRYYQTALAYEAQIIVRITSDCPLIDPSVIEHVVQMFLDAEPDYASNVLIRTYPRGLDTEVMTLKSLELAWRGATQPYQRMHVTPYIYENPDLFRLLPVTHETDFSVCRWTVDTLEDLAFVRAVYAYLGNDVFASWTDVLNLLEREPALAELNRQIRQKALHKG